MSVCFLEDNIEATNAPESDEVTKNVTIKTKDKTDNDCAMGYTSNTVSYTHLRAHET